VQVDRPTLESTVDAGPLADRIERPQEVVTPWRLALENGASPKAVQAILGHSTLGLTMTVYAKATERAKRDAISALPFAKASVPEHVVAFPGQSGIPAHTSSESSPQTFGNLAVASAT